MAFNLTTYLATCPKVEGGKRSPNVDRLVQQSTFIFRGTVKKAKATTMPPLRPSDSTAIVTVNEVLHAPKAIGNYGGARITSSRLPTSWCHASGGGQRYNQRVWHTSA
jgi:hypothetical protein